MLDRDLAEMYGVTTFRLNEAVKRNKSRFPPDFMFQLTEDEFNILTSQFAMSSLGAGWGGIRRPPFAFTEHGIAMLASVLRSERAVQASIQIIRIYIKMKQFLLDNRELWRKIENIEQQLMKKDEEVQAIFKTLKQLLLQENRPKIGFAISKQN